MSEFCLSIFWLKRTDLCFIADSVTTWGPYLYTTVSDGRQPLFFFFPFLASENVFALQSLLDDVGLADVSSAAQAVQAAVEQQQFKKATELWSVAETVVEQVGTTASRRHHSKKVWWCGFMNSWFSRQNTNGVNFYNILTQDPEQKLGENLRVSTENFIGKTRYRTIPVASEQLAGSGGMSHLEFRALFFFFFNPTAALQTHRHIRRLHRQPLSQLMNGPIREKLGIIPKNVTWGGTRAFLRE